MLHAQKIVTSVALHLFLSLYLHIGYVISTAAPSTTAARIFSKQWVGTFFLKTKKLIFMMEFYMYVKAIKYWLCLHDSY